MVYLRWNDLGAELGLNTDGVVARADLACLLALDDAVRAILAGAQAHKDAAHEAAQQLLEKADADALARTEATETQCRASARLGYWQGHKQAMTDWHRLARAGQRDAAARYAGERERLAQVVADTVRGLVLAEPPKDFYAAALTLLDKQAEIAGRMVLYAHPDDCAHAQAALDTQRGRWPAGLSVRVEADPQASRHACRVESDTGYLDAGLDVQLAALMRCLREDPIPSLP